MDAPAGKIQRVEVAVDADVAADLVLIEVNRLEVERSGRTKISRRNAAHMRAVGGHAVQRWKIVGRSDRVEDVRRTPHAPRPGESRSGDDEPLMREPPDIVVDRCWPIRRAETVLVLAPQVAKR